MSILTAIGAILVCFFYFIGNIGLGFFIMLFSLTLGEKLIKKIYDKSV